MDTLVLQFLISILKCSRANIHDDQLISRFEFASHVRMRIGNFGGGARDESRIGQKSVLPLETLDHWFAIGA